MVGPLSGDPYWVRSTHTAHQKDLMVLHGKHNVIDRSNAPVNGLKTDNMSKTFRMCCKGKTEKLLTTLVTEE